MSKSQTVYEKIGHIGTDLQRRLLLQAEEDFRYRSELQEEFIRDVAAALPLPSMSAPLKYWSALFTSSIESTQKRFEILREARLEMSKTIFGGDVRLSGEIARAAEEFAEQVEKNVHHPLVKVTNETAQSFADDVDEAVERTDDELQQIEGVGPAMADALRSSGISTIGDLARLDIDLLKDSTHPLRPYAGNIVSGQWVEQARELIAA